MILNISQDDYANYSHDNARSLRSIGVDCIDLTERPHKNNYKSMSTQCDRKDMIDYIKKAHVIQVMHSYADLFHLAKKHAKGEIIIHHTGTRYRMDHLEYEKLFKGHRSITCHTEFMKLGNHKYIRGPIELPEAPYYKGGRIKVAHYPNKTHIKGTDQIIEMLTPFQSKIKWSFSDKLVDHVQQLERISKCDVYIEMFKPELFGKEYGCFGVTALEAASMGKIVITNNLYPEVYEKVYGKCPFIIANTPEEFHNIINGLLKWSADDIRRYQRETAQITRENHSFEATGQKIYDAIYGQRASN